MTDAFAGKGNGCRSSDSAFYMGCGTAGRCRHRPLRKRYKRCGERATARVAPTKALHEARCGEESPSHGFAVPAPFRQGGQGDGGCGLPQPVTSVTGFAMTHYKKCIGRADVGIGPYGSVTRGAMGGRPQGPPLRMHYWWCVGDRGRFPCVRA